MLVWRSLLGGRTALSGHYDVGEEGGGMWSTMERAAASAARQAMCALRRASACAVSHRKASAISMYQHRWRRKAKKLWPLA